MTKLESPFPFPAVADQSQGPKRRRAIYVIAALLALEFGAGFLFHSKEPEDSVIKKHSEAPPPRPLAAAPPDAKSIRSSQEGCKWVELFNRQHGTFMKGHRIGESGDAEGCP